MAILVNFDGKQILEPGSYSRITSGFSPAPAASTYGDVVLVDTGSGKGFGFGAGVNGELAQGNDAVYEFASATDAKAAIRGGLLYDLMDYLWTPAKNGRGPRRVFVVRAATTVAAKGTMNYTNGSGLIIAAKNEGTGGNGTVANSVLTNGYGWKLKAGVVNTAKFIVEFYEGTYRGADANGVDYEVAASKVANKIIVRSDEVATVQELIAWMKNSATFKAYFAITAEPAAYPNGGALVAGDLATLGTQINVFAGGTTAYNVADVDSALEAVEEMENSLFLCDNYGIVGNPTAQEILDGANKGAQCSANVKILSHILNNATYTDKYMFVGGGKDSSEYTAAGGTLATTAFYDSESVVVAHSDVLVPGLFGGSTRYMSTLYHAAMACGLVAGLEPQVPATFKALRVLGVKHVMKKSDREKALTGGVWHLRKVGGQWVVNQAINSLQRNSSLFNTDGSSYEISIKRIKHQLNKELKIDLATQLAAIGANYNLVDAEDVKLFVERKLQSKVATRQVDNLIISFRSVVVTLVGDAWDTQYCFVVNGPINKMFTTGFMLDPNVELNNQ